MMEKMFNLTTRQLQIITRIITEPKVTSQQLSEIHRISTRSIHYDLDMIEYYLKRQGMALVKSRTDGIKIECDSVNKKKLSLMIEDASTGIDFPCLLAIEFLLRGRTTVTKLADDLQVSRNKITQALPETESILLTAGLTIDKRPSVGMEVIGSERLIRIAKFKLNSLIPDGLEKYFTERLSHFHVKKVTDAVNSYQRTTGVGFSDLGVKELVLSLCYQQLRISQGHHVAYDYNEMKEAILAEDFEVIKTCFEQSDILLNVEEIIFVLHQIRNTQVLYLPDAKKNVMTDSNVDKLTKDFALLVSERLGIDFSGNGNFLNGLKLHLNVAMHRLRTGQIIKNPLTESVKYKYRFIFETCKQIIMQLESDYDLNFPDDEIAYIAMHVGACFEIVNQVGYRPKALVICNSGLATSNLLATRLKVMLPELSILGPMALSEFEKNPEMVNNVDFVISTIAISITEKDVIIVNPLLGIDDVLALKKRVINTTSKKELSYLVSDAGTNSLILGDLLNRNKIQLQVGITSWRLAIEKAASPLISAGSIKSTYIKAMIAAVENFGPYMVFIPEIAIVHAAPSAGVIKDDLSIMTLDKPLTLGDSGDTTVRCFIVLATAQKESMLFINLVSLLDKKENINQILDGISIDEILQISND